VRPDPMGFAGGDINLYPYCLSNPINRVDPKGDIVFLLAAPAVYTLGMALTDLAIIGALGWGAQQVLERILDDIDRDFKSGCEEDYSRQNVLDQVLFAKGIRPADPTDLGPLKGAPSLPYPGANIGSPDPNLPPPPKPPKRPKTLWEKIKFVLIEGAKRIPWILPLPPY